MESLRNSINPVDSNNALSVNSQTAETVMSINLFNLYNLDNPADISTLPDSHLQGLLKKI